VTGKLSMKVFLDENSELNTLNEMFVNVLPSMPSKIENSIYYNRLKHLLMPEIITYCKEFTDMRDDLLYLRAAIGTELSEDAIRAYLDGLKEKYNDKNNNIGLDYHIEATRIDYGVPVFVIIKRTDISMKKFVFRFRKTDVATGMDGLSPIGVPLS
jgi:hypothetical protein